MKLHGCKKHGKNVTQNLMSQDTPGGKKDPKFLLTNLKYLIFPVKHLYLLKAIRMKQLSIVFFMEFVCLFVCLFCNSFFPPKMKTVINTIHMFCIYGKINQQLKNKLFLLFKYQMPVGHWQLITLFQSQSFLLKSSFTS